MPRIQKFQSDADRVLRLKTIGYQGRPAAWMNDCGLELKPEDGFMALYDHFELARILWINDACIWALTNERFGCLSLLKDDSNRTAVAGLVQAIMTRPYPSDILNAGAAVMKQLDSKLPLSESVALHAAVHIARAAIEYRKDNWDQKQIAEHLCEAIALLYTKQCLVFDHEGPVVTRDDALAVADKVFAIHEAGIDFRISMANAIEQSLYPGRAPYVRPVPPTVDEAFRDASLSLNTE